MTTSESNNRPGPSSPVPEQSDLGRAPDSETSPPPAAEPESARSTSPSEPVTPPKPIALRRSTLRAVAGVFQGSRRTATAEISTVLGFLLALVVAVVTLVVNLLASSKNPPPDVMPTAVPIPTDTPTPEGGTNLEYILLDDFSGPALDPAKWDGVDTAAPLLYVRDGMLHLQVTPAEGTGENSATLRARLPRPVHAVRFELTLLSVDGTNDGGASTIVSRNSARNHKVGVGPSGSGAPVIAYDICAREVGCRDGVYNDFVRPGVEMPIQVQRRYEVVVRRDGPRWVFEVDGIQQNTADLEDGPIESLSYYLYSFGEGTFHATVDDLEVAYAT